MKRRHYGLQSDVGDELPICADAKIDFFYVQMNEQLFTVDVLEDVPVFYCCWVQNGSVSVRSGRKQQLSYVIISSQQTKHWEEDGKYCY